MSIAAAEVAEIFQQALRGEIAVTLIGSESWADVFCGDVQYAFSDWKVTFFNDGMDLDYVDSVTAPDGRMAEYQDWFEGDERRGADPIDLLSPADAKALHTLLENIEPEAR